MENIKSIIVLICLTISLARCIPRRKGSDYSHKFYKTGEGVAIVNLIAQYEREHQQFYREITKKGGHLRWPALNNKDLSNYCKKYLHHIIPSRTNKDSATGKEMIKTLNYKIENTSNISVVVMVQCKVRYNHYQLAYYMTRTFEPNCVYALKSSGNKKKYTFTIIHKHCDFEDKPFSNKPLKHRKVEIISKMHRETGQPIARNEYLLQYELEHQEMIKKTGKKGDHLQWTHAVLHHNLNLYCYMYLQECSPDRNRENVMGNWTVLRMRYQKLTTGENISVTTVKCMLPYAYKIRFYYITKAPEPNCVYALLRTSRSKYVPLVIIFKHCDFDDPSNDQLSKSQGNDVICDKNVIQKSAAVEETLDTKDML